MQFIVQQVGVAGVAFLALYLLNKAHLDGRQREQEMGDSKQADKVELVRVTSDAARTLAEVVGAVHGLEGAVDEMKGGFAEMKGGFAELKGMIAELRNERSGKPPASR